MNTASHAPSPDPKSAAVPEGPRKKSIPPPLPRRDSAPPPTPIEAPQPHHRWSNWAKLVSIGTVALLVTSMLVRSRGGSGEPQTLRAGVSASKETIIPPRQFVELDEVLIEGALYDKEDIQPSARFDCAEFDGERETVRPSIVLK